MTASLVYQGKLRCVATHLQSKSIVETDAPTDNKGKGERFSPTDLLCVSLATCAVTTMGIKADTMNIDLEGTSVSVTKHMASDPRRVARVDIIIEIPGIDCSEKDRTILERSGDTCPVAKSLHPDLEAKIEYKWL